MRATRMPKQNLLLQLPAYLGHVVHDVVLKQNGSMAISFEVYANVKLGSCGVQMFDTSRHADYREAQNFLDVFGRRTVSVGRLHHPHLHAGSTLTLQPCDVFCAYDLQYLWCPIVSETSAASLL